MSETAVGHLVTALEAGETVTFDGLEARRTDDGYTLAVGETRHEDLGEERFREVATRQESYVTNWHFFTHVTPDGPARSAFLRWLEGADDTAVPDRYEALASGHRREWGQLAITVELGEDGRRRYELRHADDVGTPVADLTGHEDPLDARLLAKHDDDGRYRPLKTAPTLVDGWLFTDLSAADLLTAVDFFYPATVANWHREREGDLDVSHYRETAERQTGIYDVIDEMDVEAVEWMAEACCVDSQCLKRREWDEDEETELDVPRGDGEFPCREPCSLVVAAARKWTILENEEPRTYEFELTPSEKAQLEDVVDAVADGRVGEIREADVFEGANRYRARFLRAKRYDDDGNLAGVPAIPETDEDGD
jgi:hypothetical protein